jgi:Domain of unknown function (DUF4190)
MSRPETATRAGATYAPPAAPQRTSKMAIWSLILSIVWLGGLGSLAGIALGVSARRRIAATGERGAGLAIAGIVIGVLTLIFAIVYWAVIARHMGGTSGGGGGGGGY